MAELLFMRDGELQMRASLRQDRVVIGRAAQSDFVIPDRAVSRQQCAIIKRGAGFALIDLSGHGTAVSQRQASEHGSVLRDGDEIHLGVFGIVFSAAEVPAPAEATVPFRGRKNKTGLIKREEPIALRTRLRLRQPEGESVVPLRAEDGFAIELGSDPAGSVQLELKDQFVSATHCRIAWVGGRWILTDLKSSNGTFVEGVRVLECVLAGRLALRLGETIVWFEQDFADEISQEQPLPGLVSRDQGMVAMVELVRRIAPSHVPVAIHGETGAGKEVVARAVHLLSPRRDGPFVALNCGAIPTDTVESELFGHERGSFTGAERQRIGAFTEANGGTLFLDEIGDLPQAVQVKLLRVLERGEIRKLGASRTEAVNVRIVSATHRDLLAAVEDGSFREDLYYRLCVAPIEIPPLRQRLGDVMPMAEHFAGLLMPGQRRVTFSNGARAKLEGHMWRGNARELRNVVQLALLNRTGGVITENDITLRASPRPPRTLESIRLAGKTLEEIEREAYRLALERHDWDKKNAQEELGVSRSTFFRKIEELGLMRMADRPADQRS